jgi:stage II sporulation protein P
MNNNQEDVKTLAAISVFPNANMPYEIWNLSEKCDIKKNNDTKEEITADENTADITQTKTSDKDEESSTTSTVNKIVESQFGASGVRFNNFYVNNKTGIELDIGAELKKQPDVHIKKDNTPQVLIMHTHTSEAYMEKDQGFYSEDYCPRTTDCNLNVTRVGAEVARKLEESNIKVIHDKTFHDSPSYRGSYDRAEKTIKKNLVANPSIQVVLDLHRDSLGDKERGKIKPTFIYDGKKAAQIMILAGFDREGSDKFSEWEMNLRLALRLHQTAETLYPGMTRALYFNRMRYNMNLTHGSVLIEVGSDANTIDEAAYTGSMLGNVVAKVLDGLVV